MYIQSIEDLPDVAERSIWVKKLGYHASTFQRAERQGKLEKISPGGRVAIYRKRDILKWLQLDGQEKTDRPKQVTTLKKSINRERERANVRKKAKCL